jgi:hypothetical protein
MEVRVGGIYTLSRKLGSGAFGDVYLGILFPQYYFANSM